MAIRTHGTICSHAGLVGKAQRVAQPHRRAAPDIAQKQSSVALCLPRKDKKRKKTAPPFFRRFVCARFFSLLLHGWLIGHDEDNCRGLEAKS